MNSRTRPLLAALPAAAPARSPSERLTAAEPAAACLESRTLFHDVFRFPRKNSAPNDMTKLHAEQAREGWSFANLEPYAENGDLAAFFPTFTRAAPCP